MLGKIVFALFKQGNPVSCRINCLLISYLISKQARLNAFLRAILFHKCSGYFGWSSHILDGQ